MKIYRVGEGPEKNKEEKRGREESEERGQFSVVGGTDEDRVTASSNSLVLVKNEYLCLI